MRYPKLNIVTITDGPFQGSGIAPMQSTFRVAIDNMRQKYRGLYEDYSETHLAIEDNATACRIEGNVIVLNLLQQWYGSGVFNQNGLTVILTSVCAPAYLVIGDFAREMDLLTVACGSVEISQRYPNAIAVTLGSVKTYAEAYTTVMSHFQWRTVAVINDRLSQSVFGARSTEMCRGPVERLQDLAAEFNFLIVDTDSTLGSFRKALQEARQHSRVILCCTLHTGMRRLLADAYDLNMTSGDHVFVYLYEFQIPLEYPLSWQHDDALDEKVWYGIQSVISIRSAVVDWTKYDATAEAINARRKEIFGTQPNPENKFNEFAMICYEAAEVLSYGLNATLNSDQTILTNDNGMLHIERNQFTKSIIGKTLHLSFRDASFLPSGQRRPEIVVQQFNALANDFVDVFHYDSVSRSLIPVPGRSIEWPSGIKPVDRPVCGMRGELCGTNWKPGTTVAIVIVAVVVLVITFICCRIRRARHATRWWEIKEGGPSTDGYSVLPVKSTNLSSLSANQDTTAKLTQRLFLVNGVKAYRRTLLWDPQWQCSAGKRLNQYLLQLKRPDHENINAFVGLSIGIRPPTIYFQFCSKGSVENLMENVTIDYTLKLSLIQNLIAGLSYLHLSAIKLHGNLQSSKCLVDHYFTLKISDYGQEKLSVLLRKKQLRHLRRELTVKRPFFPVNVWMAPEVMRGHAPMPACDVYAAGIVCHQIVMECSAFGLDCYGTRWESLMDIKALTINEVIKRIRTGQVPPFRPSFPKSFEKETGNF
ncbi:atrial natriuretic peptide receptor 1-like [Paramacrobiotus metropolitanus]|uniref:atrial natriuretic peptide receptor 1-like n=1 Tax=Paramacrobiotus metropolitanus TaxID=2943436 RepID=UPI002445AAFA|nr:atrial natriuretic peptide receptor 1-like [Paramacrobiotus metropolitanus]